LGWENKKEEKTNQPPNKPKERERDYASNKTTKENFMQLEGALQVNNFLKLNNIKLI